MNSEKLPIEEALQIIRTAFKPFRCVAELYDYNEKVRFRVFDLEGNALVRMEKIKPLLIEDPQELRNIITTARDTIKEKGNELEPWTYTKDDESG